MEIAGRNGWDVLKRVGRQVSRDRISIIAAGVAFYALFAIFPGLAALVSIYGLLFDPQQIGQQVQALGAILPPEAADILVQQLADVSASGRTGLGFAAAGGLLLALWSAAKGVKTLMEALNVAYHERERRGFFRLNATALLLTLGAVVSTVIAISLIVALPAIIAFVGLGRLAEALLAVGHLALLALLMGFGMAVIYRFGPSRAEPRWAWVTPGAIAGTVLWLAGSALFAIYVRNFASYNETYGSMGAVVILLTWFLLTAYAILIGAEINGEVERRKGKDNEWKPASSTAAG
jgi:membrane protein